MAKLPNRLSHWESFLEWYAKDPHYWYFPKGRSVQASDLIDAFRVMKDFEGQTWGGAQENYLDALEDKGLFSRRGNGQTEADATAMARMYKVVFSFLGLAWVEENERIALTKAGAAFLSANDPSSVIGRQVQRYQIYNPSQKSGSSTFAIRPHIFLLDVLLNVGNRIYHEEYCLFIARSRTHKDLDQIVNWIISWRALGPADKALLWSLVDNLHDLGGRRGSLLNTIKLNKSYALTFLTFCEYLTRPLNSDVAVRLKLANRYEAEALVRKYSTEAVYINFATEKDWFAYYGDYERFPSLEEATDYYIDTSQTDKLGDVVASAEAMDAQISEKILEDFLEKNLHRLEPGLKLIGRQYGTITGPIDLFCRDKNNNLVVVELKKGRASDRVIGQLLRYIGFVRENLLEKAAQEVRGIIVSREIDKKLEMAVSGLGTGNVQLRTFSANVTIN